MTITLQDVGIIAGLPVDGLAVSASEDVDNWDGYCARLLGRIPDRGKTRTTVRRTWFAANMSVVPHDATEEEVRQYARAYILCMLGTTLMPDNSGSEISLHYLPLLEDLDRVIDYSWGSAVLAFLYRQLCVAAADKSNVWFAGCSLLLQYWAWEHMYTGCPKRISDPVLPHDHGDLGQLGLPSLAFRNWKGAKTFVHVGKHVVVIYRDSFDRQEASDLIWTPYSEDILAILNPLTVQGRHIWCSEVPQINFNIIEWHYPSRVIRQFGLKQIIPGAPHQSHKELHEHTRRKNRVNWPQELSSFVNSWARRNESLIIGELEDDDDSYLREYMRWYSKITRRFLQPKSKTEEPKEYRPNSYEHPKLVQTLVRSARRAAKIFKKKSWDDARKEAYEAFQEAQNELIQIGAGDALEDVLDATGEDAEHEEHEDFPDSSQFEEAGPSQVTQLSLDQDGLRRSTRQKYPVCRSLGPSRARR